MISSGFCQYKPLSKCVDPGVRRLPRLQGQTAVPGRRDGAVSRARAQEVRAYAGDRKEGRQASSGVDLGCAEGRV